MTVERTKANTVIGLSFRGEAEVPHLTGLRTAPKAGLVPMTLGTLLNALLLTTDRSLIVDMALVLGVDRKTSRL